MVTTFIVGNLKDCLIKKSILLKHDYGITPNLSYSNTNKIRVKFDGACLKQDPRSLFLGGIVNVYVVYEISKNINISDYPTLENCLFGAVKLTKNADIDKYGYSGYGIGFDRRSSFSFPSGGFGQNIIIFGVDMSSSTKIDNRKKDILILGEGPTQGLEHTTSAEKLYSINFTEKKAKDFVYAWIIIKKIAPYLLMSLKLLNLKPGLNEYVYGSSVHHDTISVDDIGDIHKYLMKKKVI